MSMVEQQIGESLSAVFVCLNKKPNDGTNIEGQSSNSNKESHSDKNKDIL